MLEKTVLIVGGGPAGASCAWKLQNAGMDVLVLDKAAFPRRKLCAGWITPQVFQLLGTSPQDYPHGLLRFRRLICYFRGLRVPVKTRQYSIRRYEFDRWLLERAGAPVEQHAVKHIRRENQHYIVDERYRARYLVGAGGTHCPVYRQLFGRVCPRPGDRRISTVEEEFCWDYKDGNCYLWFFDEGLPGYAWYVPKAGGYVNIGIGGKDAAIKKQGRTIRQYWRHFTGRLQSAGLLPAREFAAQGHVYYTRGRKPLLSRENAFIAGDAAGLATADMGEGIGPAIQSGFRAAEAILHQSPCTMPAAAKYSWPSIILSGLGDLRRNEAEATWTV